MRRVGFGLFHETARQDRMQDQQIERAAPSLVTKAVHAARDILSQSRKPPCSFDGSSLFDNVHNCRVAA